MPEKAAFTFSLFATTTQRRKFFEVFDGFEAEWEAQGFLSLSSEDVEKRLSGFAPHPREWDPKGPINSAFGPPHFFQFVAFLKEPATTAAIEVVLGTIFHAVIGRFRAFFTPRSDKPDVQFPIKFCPALWFEREQVLVTVVADIGSPADFKVAEVLFPEGFVRAGQWLARHGVTHPYLTYRIRDGKLDAIPTLSQRPHDE